MFKTLTKLIGGSNEGVIKKIRRQVVEDVNALEPEFEAMSDAELRAMTDEFRERLRDGETLDDILHEAFATVREAAKRTLGQRHFDVQLIGGFVLHEGKIAEMRTGEGKTLVATLPAYLNALAGEGVHVVTVNDYLARRDAQWMGQVYDALGISVGVLQHEGSYVYQPAPDGDGKAPAGMEALRATTRQEAYAADITYGTNNEFGFDFLRDNMKRDASEKAQSNLTFAIVDEVDNILIDEARTPLIISAPSEQSSRDYSRFARMAPNLAAETDYTIDEKAPLHLAHARRHEQGGAIARNQVPVRRQRSQLPHRPPRRDRAQGAEHLPARPRLRRLGRQRGHSGRVHRQADDGPSLLGWPAPGNRGQRGRPGPQRDHHLRHYHAAKLLPPVPEVGRHDRNRRYRSRRVLEDIQAGSGRGAYQ